MQTKNSRLIKYSLIILSYSPKFFWCCGSCCDCGSWLLLLLQTKLANHYRRLTLLLSYLLTTVQYRTGVFASGATMVFGFSSSSTTARRIRPLPPLPPTSTRRWNNNKNHNNKPHAGVSLSSRRLGGQVVRLLVGLFASSSSSSSSWSSSCCWPGTGLVSLVLLPLAQLEVQAETLYVISYVRPLGGTEGLGLDFQTSPSGMAVAVVYAHGSGPGSFHLSPMAARLYLNGGKNDTVVTLTLEMVVFQLLPSHPCYGVDPTYLHNYNRGAECDESYVPGLGIQRQDRRWYCCNTATAAQVDDDPALACPVSNNDRTTRGSSQLLFDNATTSVTGRRFATVQGHRGDEIPIPLLWQAVDDDNNNNNNSIDKDPSVMAFVESGIYTVVVADCGSSSEALDVSGSVVVTNSHGSLPAHLWPVVRLYGAVFVVYVVLLVLYSLGLYRKSRTSRPTTPVECGIVLAMLLGTLEAGLRWTEIRVWNAAGERSLDVLLATDVLGVLVRTWLRSFVVILSHGWTVTRPSLGRHLTACVVVASFAYMAMCGVSAAVGYIAITKFRAGSLDSKSFFYPMMDALRWALAVLDVAFAVWVVAATTCTLRYLTAVQQRAKLRRYKALRWMASLYILTSMGLILARQAVWRRYSPVSPQYCAVILLGQVVPLLFVASLAVLWRPQRTSWQYTYAPQVPHDDPSLMELTPLASERLEPPVRRRRRSTPTEFTLGSSGDPVDSGSAHAT